MQPFGTMQDSGGGLLPKQFSWKLQLDVFNPVGRFLASLLLVFLTVGVTKVQSQVVINEVLANTSVELKNVGNSTVNVSNYWLCNFPDYAQLSQLNIVCGDLDLAPGEFLTVEVDGSVGGVEVPGNDGELGLYINSSFGSPNSIRDYVEWGSSGHGRSSVAVAAGIWSSGNFVSAFGANESIEYTGTGDEAASWASTASPTINCMENSNAGNDCDVFVNDINLPGGATSTSICVDGVGDPLDVETNGGTADASRGWIITDDVGNILALPAAPPFDLDGAGVGVCEIWYIRYEDNGEFGGNTVGNNLTDLTGCYALSNPVTVIREAPDGGMVSLTNGETTYTGTAGDIVVQVQHTTAAPNLSYWYIITDDNDNILAFMNSANGNSLDLSGAPPGECHIWGWSYRGLADPVVRDNISTLTDDACEAISDNFIRVIREADDCDVFVNDINLPGGATSTSICVDGVGDPLEVETNGGTADASRGWIITDDVGNILALPAAPPFDLDGAGVGVCEIWYIRYEDNGEFGGNTVGNNLTDLTGCYALSNPVTVIREAPDGGMVSLTNGETTYTGTAGDIVVQVQHTTAAPNLSYWYIITDDNDNILAFMNSANGNSLDLSGAPPGECHIWGWSYRGLADPVVGDHISTLTDDACEAISDNFIRVIREPEVCDIYVGRIKLKYGGTRRTICVDDTPDPLYVRTSGGTPNTSRAWIITDDAGNILATPAAPPFDLNGAGVGVCQIWYLRYYDTEEFGGNEVGNNLSDLTGCYAISNPITVVRKMCEASCDAPSFVRVTRVTRNTATIDWNDVSSAVTYHVRYRRAFSNRWRYRVTSRSNTTLRRLRRNTKYFVQVRTYCAGPERSEWTNVKTFRTSRGGYYLQDNTEQEAAEANNQVTEFANPDVTPSNEGSALDSQVLPLKGIEQGRSEFEQAEIRLFPNPVQSTLNIETNMQGEQVIARIFSTTGQLVKQLQLAGDQLQSVDLTELQAGMYILNIQNGEQQLSRTFIKQ